MGKQMRCSSFLASTIFIMSLIASTISLACEPENKTITKLTDGVYYNVYTQTEGIAHFSLEYGTKFKYNGVVKLENWAFSVWFEGPPVSDKTGTTHTAFGVNIWDTKSKTAPYSIASTSDTARTWLNKRLSRIEEINMSGFLEGKLLDKSEITVDGVRADKIIFLEGLNIAPRMDGIKEQFYWVKRQVFFDYNGLIWIIEMSSDQSTAAVDGKDFEHILQTFKFLP